MSYTTLEQSKRLLELGLDPETADMNYPMFYHRAIDGGGKHLSDIPEAFKAIGEEDVPCWSLDALLEAMPQYINQYNNGSWKSYHLNLFRSYYHCCSYSFGPSLKTEDYDNLICKGAESWIDAVYMVVIYCLTNGYIKTVEDKKNTEDCKREYTKPIQKTNTEEKLNLCTKIFKQGDNDS